MGLVDRSSVEAAGSLLMMGCAAVIAFISAGFLFVFPLILWMIFGDQDEAGHWGIIWFLLALGVVFFNIARAIHVLQDQTPRDLTLMLCASGVVILSCPLTLRALSQ